MLDQRKPRLTVLSWLLWALILCAMIGGLLYTAPAHATSYSSRDNAGNVITLTDEKCEGTPPWMNMHKAMFRYRGKDYNACWFPVANFVIVLDESGDVTPIEKERFSKDPEV